MEKKSQIKERILQFVEFKKIKKVDFFTQIGVDSSNFRGETLNSDPNTKVIVRILTEYCDISAEWLLLGKGEMLTTPGSQLPAPGSQPDERLSEPSSDYHPTSASQENQLLRQHIAALERTIRDKEEIIHLLKQKL